MNHLENNEVTSAACKQRPKKLNRALRQKKHSGQAAVLIALAIVVLIAIIGLAIDGGAAYADRRTAQNSADAAAMAATRVMLDAYMAMVADNPDYDVDGSAESDHDIRAAIDDYATRHGIDPSSLHAYYVDDNKRIVGGVDQEVGNVYLVPWTQGAKGVWVKNRSESNTFFMNIFGWTKIGAVANSTAFMGPTVQSSSDIAMLPIGFFTNTYGLNNMVIGQTYTLIEGDSLQGDGNWGYLDYNAEGGSATVNEAWVHCGFNPTISSDSQWTEWADSQGSDCASYDNVNHTHGPTAHYKCAHSDPSDPLYDPTCSYPEDNVTYVPYHKYGYQTDGWWLGGSTGSVRQSCDDLAALVDGANGLEFNVPIIDMTYDTGMNTRYHLLSIGRFLITTAVVDCHIHGNTGDHSHWHIEGQYLGFYLDATGHHGDVRHASANTVFLDN